VKAHIFCPLDGVRLFNQSHKEAVNAIQNMPKSDDRTIIITKAGIKKSDLIADLKNAIEYARKDLP